jgi:hypothetical protein
MTAMKFMQLFSDRRGSELAAQISGRLQQDIGGDKCGETVWNTELLRSAKLRMIAAREAAEADFVIIAGEEGARLSPELRQWLQLWKRRQRRKRATLVAILQRDRTGASRNVERALHAFARASRMDFFCHSRVELKTERQIKELSFSFLA